jgi:hypothetical protein
MAAGTPSPGSPMCARRDMSKIRALLIPTMNITRDNYPEVSW